MKNLLIVLLAAISTFTGHAQKENKENTSMGILEFRQAGKLKQI